jgi:hypothetical protein
MPTSCSRWRNACAMPGLAGVVGEVTKYSTTASKRLQLAAEGSGVPLRLSAAPASPMQADRRHRRGDALADHREPERGSRHSKPRSPRAGASRLNACAAAIRTHGSWRAAMRRVVSLFLPHWSTDRLRRKTAKSPPDGATPHRRRWSRRSPTMAGASSRRSMRGARARHRAGHDHHQGALLRARARGRRRRSGRRFRGSSPPRALGWPALLARRRARPTRRHLARHHRLRALFSTEARIAQGSPPPHRRLRPVAADRGRRHRGLRACGRAPCSRRSAGDDRTRARTARRSRSCRSRRCGWPSADRRGLAQARLRAGRAIDRRPARPARQAVRPRACTAGSTRRLGHVPEPIEPIFPDNLPRARRGFMEPIATPKPLPR